MCPLPVVERVDRDIKTGEQFPRINDLTVKQFALQNGRKLLSMINYINKERKY